MNAATTPFESQARLWLVAFAVSAVVNLAALGAVGFWVLAKIALQPVSRGAVAADESVAVIVPEMIVGATGEPAPAVVPAAPPPAPPRYARTSPDQAEEAPERPDFMGERNTRATSDAAPVAEAPEQPSQKGREPLWEDEVETTQSRYQDGDLAHDRINRTGEMQPAVSTPPPAPAPPPAESADTAKRDGTGETDTPPAEATRERLAEGPAPVERRVEEGKPDDEPKPARPERRSEGQQAEQKTAPPPPKPAANPAAPGFRGNQTKTKLVGSIARTGRSALNVEDSVLGRYHAAVSRAVEKEWQLNCVRNRDFITPGMLTMSFMLDTAGKVREIRVIEDLRVGAIPKGFTLNAINDAAIPAMPADLKKQLNGEPLELIYRFSF